MCCCCVLLRVLVCVCRCVTAAHSCAGAYIATRPVNDTIIISIADPAGVPSALYGLGHQLRLALGYFHHHLSCRFGLCPTRCVLFHRPAIPQPRGPKGGSVSNDGDSNIRGDWGSAPHCTGTRMKLLVRLLMRLLMSTSEQRMWLLMSCS